MFKSVNFTTLALPLFHKLFNLALSGKIIYLRKFLVFYEEAISLGCQSGNFSLETLSNFSFSFLDLLGLHCIACFFELFQRALKDALISFNLFLELWHLYGIFFEFLNFIRTL
jgi:hypothetical protein